MKINYNYVCLILWAIVIAVGLVIEARGGQISNDVAITVMLSGFAITARDCLYDGDDK